MMLQTLVLFLLLSTCSKETLSNYNKLHFDLERHAIYSCSILLTNLQIQLYLQINNLVFYSTFSPSQFFYTKLIQLILILLPQPYRFKQSIILMARFSNIKDSYSWTNYGLVKSLLSRSLKTTITKNRAYQQGLLSIRLLHARQNHFLKGKQTFCEAIYFQVIILMLTNYLIWMHYMIITNLALKDLPSFLF